MNESGGAIEKDHPRKQKTYRSGLLILNAAVSMGVFKLVLAIEEAHWMRLGTRFLFIDLAVAFFASGVITWISYHYRLNDLRSSLFIWAFGGVIPLSLVIGMIYWIGNGMAGS